MPGKPVIMKTRVGNSHAERNREVRVKALRDQLSAQGHVQHVIDIIDKLTDLDKGLDQIEVARLKVAMDGKFKLIGKYMPDLKSIEIQTTVTNKTDFENKDQRELIQLAKEKLKELELLDVIEGEVIDEQ